MSSKADLYRHSKVNPLAVQMSMDSRRLVADANTKNLWLFNEGFGTHPLDYGSDHADGNMLGMTWAAGGPFGKSAYITAVTATYGLTVPVISAVTGSQTWEFVMRPCANFSPSDAMMFENGNGYASDCVDAYYVKNGVFGFRFWKAGPTEIDANIATPNPSVGVWMYIAVVFAAGQTLKGYLNGVEASNADASAFTTLQSYTNVTFGFRTADGNSSAQYEFSVIRRSDIARSAAEILLNARLMGFA